MTHPPTSPSIRGQLSRLMDALQRSGESRLVRVEVAAAPVSPAVRPSAWWHDGERGETYAGYGEVLSASVEGDDRTAQMSALFAGWRRRWLTPASLTGLPMAFGGLSFDPAHARHRRWKAWGDARFSIPAILVREEAGMLRRFVTVEAAADVSLDALVAQVQEANAATAEEPLAQVGAPADAPLTGGADAARGYADRVAAAVDFIASGAVEKVVVTREACYAPPAGYQISMRHTFEALRDGNPTAYTFLLTGPDGTSFIGAPPETLARLERGQLSTHALAGTAPRGATPDEDHAYGAALLGDAKENDEHDVVVREIEASLRSLAPQAIRREPKALLRLAHVQHLSTPVRAELAPETDVVTAIDALHPTPAVGGAPRSEALDWLRAHEGYDRGWYCGPVGWVSAEGDGVFCVALRSALLTPDEAVGYVGAGIVATSDPEREWVETEMKLRTVATAIRLEPREG